ncbi:CBS domain-containing protein [Desulfolutivibrio sulfoxidireducens]|uniref:CBS domain-containing protein n=1 Tax=Desulfolutivibrio sulfoxidireducens TaxID=2773299 RepID=UPI00159E0832|nr:CBS domain-containing protein [Desulfolutivibrio sulfoxidireducens]QLA17874.1 CBS domain-containing protein [Desulfolutivibrio sulfoxidireducens]QLA21454.1 CBS domain-containing protein [Desulfolutivibrio sulfoxidireducens]
MRVSDIMTSRVLALGENDSLETAMRLMEDMFIRHIPIVDDTGALTGLITQRDLLAAMRRKDENAPIREAMRTDVTTVGPDESLRRAAEIMIYNKFGCLPVLVDQKPVGIITETDFLKLAIFPLAPGQGNTAKA